MDATEKRLAEALAEFTEAGPGGRLRFTRDAGSVADVARAVHAQMLASAARDDDPFEAPASVHVCCEHVPGSPASSELDVMDKIAGLLQHRTPRSRRRVLTWARDFLLDRDEPPF